MAHRVLARYTESLGVKFLVGGNELPHTSVFMPESFLPVVVAHAQRIWRRMSITDGVMDQTNSLGAVIFDAPDALFGVSTHCATVDPGLISTLRLLAFTKSLNEVFFLEQDKIVDLDPYIEHFQKLEWEDGIPLITIPNNLIPEQIYGMDVYEPMSEQVELSNAIGKPFQGSTRSATSTDSSMKGRV